jgi:nitrite reductase (NO-forming)
MSLRVVLAVAFLVFVAGCSQPAPPATPTSSSSPASPMPTASETTAAAPQPTAPPLQQQVAVSAEGFYPANPTLSPAELTVASGANVTLHYTNNDLNPLGSHNLVIDGVGVVSPMIDQGESSEGTFTAPPPGDYAFYCSVQGHRDLGMEGVLHVTA